MQRFPMRRREFLQALAAARSPGCRSTPRTRPRTPTAGASTTALAPFGNVALLHFTDCHAQLLPMHFREPSVNLGVGDARGKPPHLVGEALLRQFGIAPGTRDAHAFTYLDFERAARATARSAASRISRRWSSGCAATRPRRAAARRRRHLAGLGDRAVDARPGHGRRGEAARRRRDDRPLGIHLRRRARAAKSSTGTSPDRIEFIAQNVRTADFGDPVFAPYAMREINGVAGRDHRPGVSVHADRQSALLRPRLDLRHPGRGAAEERRRGARARARRPSCCCRTTAWTST